MVCSGSRWLLRGCSLMAALGFTVLSPLSAAKGQTVEADVKFGAQLYDNWPKIIGTELKSSHPLYPDTGKNTGITTWRCKECHGWDYLGKEGRYKQGSHYTGIAGVLAAKSKSLTELEQAIGNGANGHTFSQYLAAEQVQALARFIKEGTVTMASFITPEGKGGGDAEKGRHLFAEKCAGCHDADGNGYDFEQDEGLQGVGFLANDNPQETLHKIMWGNPKTSMPSLIVDEGLGASEAADILTYAQTLP